MRVSSIIIIPQVKVCATGLACKQINGIVFVDREIKNFDTVSTALRKVSFGLKKNKSVAMAVSE